MIASVNPMLLTDDAFEKYRYIIDPQADTAAFTILNLLDHGQVYRVLGTIQKNTDNVSLEDIKNLSYKPNATEEQVASFIEFVKTFTEKYFNDLRFFQKNISFSGIEIVLIILLTAEPGMTLRLFLVKLLRSLQVKSKLTRMDECRSFRICYFSSC